MLSADLGPTAALDHSGVVAQVLEWLDERRRDGSAKLLPAVKPRRQRHLLRREKLMLL